MKDAIAKDEQMCNSWNCITVYVVQRLMTWLWMMNSGGLERNRGHLWALSQNYPSGTVENINLSHDT
jgi:hypothetical protein